MAAYPTADSNHETMEKPKKNLNVPSMHVDYHSISAMMAPRFVISLISHILFRRTKVPFRLCSCRVCPLAILNLAWPGGRTERVGAMDTLSSHLQTTFIALSTALCRPNATDTSTTQNENEVSLNATTSRPPARAHMALVVGPNVDAAKAKVVLVFDRLEVKLWGVRKDTQSVSDPHSVSDQEEYYSDETDASSESSEEEDDADFWEDHQDIIDDSTPESEEEEECQDCIDHCTRSESPPLPPRSRSPSPSPPRPSRDTSPVPSHEEIQKFLTAADGLLSRTLASAGGLSCGLDTYSNFKLQDDSLILHGSHDKT